MSVPLGAIALAPDVRNAALRVDLGDGPEWRYVFIPHGANDADSWSVAHVPTLPSLDCHQARNGTVWRDSTPDHPWLYRYHQGAWWWKTPSAHSWHPLATHDAARLKVFLNGCGPYVAVGQSAGEAH